MSPSLADELTAKQVERIFAVMKSEPVQALQELLSEQAERLARASAE